MKKLGGKYAEEVRITDNVGNMKGNQDEEKWSNEFFKITMELFNHLSSSLQLIFLHLLEWIIPSVYGMCGVETRKSTRVEFSQGSCDRREMVTAVDVEKGIEIQVFKEHQIVKVKFHPHNFNLFLSGGSKGLLKFWDVRSGKVNHEYVRNFGPILDVEFSVDGKNLITSSDVSESNLSKNSIIVWHVSLQIPLSNQFGLCCLTKCANNTVIRIWFKRGQKRNLVLDKTPKIAEVARQNLVVNIFLTICYGLTTFIYASWFLWFTIVLKIRVDGTGNMQFEHSKYERVYRYGNSVWVLFSEYS
ncbi:uncharacterized protein LOC111404647 [Olea europaea var. sylvestris]|uniref:uncharacterized protein LOC111404647 n=1 Tax=Olea europaea var. sylvestris TaxID=158386 RepID=UPI000C1D7A49|nr:uncharacterized protein LOC111404647 [Olea europaea var. sylvestris]